MPYNPSSKRHISYASFGLLVGTGTTSLRQSLSIQRPDVRNPKTPLAQKRPPYTVQALFLCSLLWRLCAGTLRRGQAPGVLVFSLRVQLPPSFVRKTWW